ncbi:MAG: OB-fold nucleic acid binding domain-containing protein [Candidatus Aenigmatarchaeota archaeon]
MPTRISAKKIRISDILNGKFFPGEKEGLKPSYLITPFGQIVSRVNIVSTIIEKFLSEDENYSSITLDDGSGAIRAKAFGEKVNLFKDLEVGDIVMIIGKIKEYAGEIYINAEIVKRVDFDYENFRRLEILKDIIEKNKMMEKIKEMQKKVSEEELKKYVKENFGMDETCLEVLLENLKVEKEIDYKPILLKLIGEMDEGDGVNMSEILEVCDLPEGIIEKTINELLSEGSLFEPLPGRFKRV